MKIRKMLYSWFGYSRSERIGSLVLVIIISTIIIIRLSDSRSFPQYKSESKSLDSLLCPADSLEAKSLFIFDPNTITRDSLLELGLSHRQVSTLINYRESGARFKVPEDFRKVYGIDEALQDSLIQYIVIRDRIIKKKISIDKTDPEYVPLNDDRRKPETEKKPESDVFDPLELNSADSVLLMTIPGIGRILGPRIVKYRELLGGYNMVSQLSEVYGIDSLKLEKIKDYMILDTSLVRAIDINKATYGELIRHPYITKKNTEDILQYRSLLGRISALNELVRNQILTDSELEKLKAYLMISDSNNIDK